MQLLHTMLRVGDLERSLRFYTEILGMKVLRKHDNKDYQYTLAFIGYASEAEQAVIELTYNWGKEHYDIGEGFGHIAIGVNNLYATCDAIRKNKGKITREPGPVLGGTTEIAFIHDPDGYSIELIQMKAHSKK